MKKQKANKPNTTNSGQRNDSVASSNWKHPPVKKTPKATPRKR